MDCCATDCFNCPYADCTCDTITSEEVAAQDRYDREVIEDIKRMQALDNGTIKFYKYNRSSKGKTRTGRYLNSPKGKATTKRYNASEKGKARQREYNSSDKGKARAKRYAQSDKGIANSKKKAKARILNGKNAEYCRRYYQKKKMEKLLLEAK